MKTADEEQRFLVVGWLVLAMTIIGVNLWAVSLYHSTPPTVQYNIIGAEHSVSQMLMWPNLVKAAHSGTWMTSSDQHSLDAMYLQDCWNDPDWLRMYIDPYCTFLWLRALEHGHTVKIDSTLAVITAQERKLGEKSKSNQNGGMRCYLDGYPGELGIRGYWKPCDSKYLSMNAENFQAEIIAFHIDRILGFYRTPPVVPKYFTEPELRVLAREAMNRTENPDDTAMFKIQTVMDKCGTRNGAEGAMVGWSNFPVTVLDLRSRILKGDYMVNMFELNSREVQVLKQNEFNITRQSPRYKITWALENVALNMFALLMGNAHKFGHSVFILYQPNDLGPRYGPFLYIDNDRSSWDNDIFRRGIVSRKHPLGVFCKFPLEIARRILSFNDTQQFTLGHLIKESVSPYQATMKELPLWTDENIIWVDQRVDYLRKQIEKCIRRYGIEDVLIPDPWLEKEYNVLEHWTRFLTNAPK